MGSKLGDFRDIDWYDEPDLITRGMTSVSKSESQDRSIIEYVFTFEDSEYARRAVANLVAGKDNVAQWNMWTGLGGQMHQLAVTRIIEKNPWAAIGVVTINDTAYAFQPGALTIRREPPRQPATRIQINPNLRLGPVLTVAGFEDADGEPVAGSAVEVYEYVSRMSGTGVIESVDVAAQWIYIAVDWDSITIKERDA